MAGVTAPQLAAACARALTPRPRERVNLDHVTPITASVTDAVTSLLLELPRARQLSFRAITAHLVDRIEVVVRFLAALELFKQGFVDLTQSGTFGDIRIHWIGDSSSDDYRLALAGADSDESALVDSYDG
jgi:segregation and condensation protein A